MIEYITSEECKQRPLLTTADAAPTLMSFTEYCSSSMSDAFSASELQRIYRK
jgi:hypothetical protein